MIGVVEFIEFVESVEFIELTQSIGLSGWSVLFVSLFSRQPISLAGKEYWGRIHGGFRQRDPFVPFRHRAY